MVGTNWDAHWNRYNNLPWRVWSRMTMRAYGRLLRHVNLEKPRILELGSGSGVNSLFLARTLKAPQVDLVDFNDAALAIARNIFSKSGIDAIVNFLRKDVLELDESDLRGKFDIVHSEGLIEHFYGEDRVSVFKKHVDYCRQDGVIIIFVPCRTFRYVLVKTLYRIIGQWIYEEREFTKKELRGLCAQFNLQILKETFLGHEIGIIVSRMLNISGVPPVIARKQ